MRHASPVTPHRVTSLTEQPAFAPPWLPDGGVFWVAQLPGEFTLNYFEAENPETMKDITVEQLTKGKKVPLPKPCLSPFAESWGKDLPAACQCGIFHSPQRDLVFSRAASSLD